MRGFRFRSILKELEVLCFFLGGTDSTSGNAHMSPTSGRSHACPDGLHPVPGRCHAAEALGDILIELFQLTFLGTALQVELVASASAGVRACFLIQCWVEKGVRDRAGVGVTGRRRW